MQAEEDERRELPPGGALNSVFSWQVDMQEYYDFDKRVRLHAVQNGAVILSSKATFALFCHDRAGSTGTMEIMNSHTDEYGNLNVNFFSTLTTAN